MSPVAWTMARVVTLMALYALFGAGCAPTRSPEFFPPLPASPRMQLLKVYETEADLKRSLTSAVVGSAPELFGRASDVALAPQGKLYVLDNFKLDQRLHEIDLRDNSRKILPLGGIVKSPVGVCADAAGRVYVADRYGSKVVRLTSGGQSERIFRRADQEAFSPVSCEVAEGRLYVPDLVAGQVVVFDAENGAQLDVWGGQPDARFALPFVVRAAGGGEFVVLEALTGQLTRVDGAGQRLRSFGGLGDKPGYFSRPKGLALDRKGLHYTTDGNYGIVQVHDEKGAIRYFFGGQSGDVGARGRLTLPAGIAVDYANAALLQPLAAPGFSVEYLVAVASQGPANPDHGNSKVLVFGFGRLAGQEYDD